MKKLVVILGLIIILALSGCSSFPAETATQIYGTPVRMDYTSYYSVIVYFDAGEPLYLRSEVAIVWEDFVALGTQCKFTITDERNTIWDNLISIERL